MAIQWRDTPLLDSVQLPGSETKYWVKDAEAREKIEELSSATKFLGVTTTEITDGSTTSTIVINGDDVTAQTGNIVIYNAGTELEPNNKEFIWNGSAWQEFGDANINDLGDLAFKDSASGSYTPEGSVSVTVASSENFYGVYSGTFDEEGKLTVLTYINDYGGVTFSVSQTLSTSFTVPIMAVTSGSLSEPLMTFGNEVTAGGLNYLPSRVITGFSDLVANQVDVKTYNNDGVMPTISNTSTITTSVSGNTLVFALSDIGFTSGSFSTVASTGVAIKYPNPEQMEYTFTYAPLEPVTLSASTSTVTASIPFEYSSRFAVTSVGVSDTYIELASYSLPTAFSATFSGSSSTITVS